MMEEMGELNVHTQISERVIKKEVATSLLMLIAAHMRAAPGMVKRAEIIKYAFLIFFLCVCVCVCV
jgi:hypothetical protein